MYSTSSPATAPASADSSNGSAAPARQTWTSSIQMSTGSGALSCSAAPTACAIRPQFGSPPCSAALTSGESATARAARVTAGSCAAVDDDAADPPRALAVAHHQDREPAQQHVERLAEAQLVLGLGLAICTPLAPDAIRIAVSLVESCPSTEMRSNERLTQTPSSRSAVSGVSPASVCDEAQHRRERGRDHPGALRLGGEPHGAGRQRDLERRALGEAVGGADRLGEQLVAVGGRARLRAAAIPRMTLSVSSGTPITPVEAIATRSSATPATIAPAPCIRAASSSPRRPVAALALPELATTARMPDEPAALLREQHRRGEHARAREARGADRLRGVGDQQPEVARRRRA